jgi:predicted Zn-dependent protease
MNNPTPLGQAKELIRKGDRDAARRFLEDLIAQMPDDPEVWLLFFEVLDNPIEKCDCLKQAVRLRPDDRKLKEKLRKYCAGAEYRDARAGIHAIREDNELKEKKKRKNKSRLKSFFNFLNELFLSSSERRTR